MKRADVPVVDVLRAYAAYRAEMDAALARHGATDLPAAVRVMMADGFPRPARPIERLTDAGFPYKVAMARIMQLVGKGLLEYGVSPEVGWLTDEGKRALADAGA